MTQFSITNPVGECVWCEQIHPNPVTIDPFSLGALARSMGADAFGATCDQVNEAARKGTHR